MLRPLAGLGALASVVVVVAAALLAGEPGPVAAPRPPASASPESEVAAAELRAVGGRGNSRRAEAAPRSPARPDRIALAPTPALRVEVRSDSAPAEGVRVEVRPVGEAGGTSSDPPRFERWSGLGRVGMRPEERPHARTDANGRCALPVGLEPPLRIVARDPRLGRAEERIDSADDVVGSRTVRLDLGATGSIEGTLVAEGAAPLSSYRIAFVDEHGARVHAPVADDGAFASERLHVGRWRVHADGPDPLQAGFSECFERLDRSDGEQAARPLRIVTTLVDVEPSRVSRIAVTRDAPVRLEARISIDRSGVERHELVGTFCYRSALSFTRRPAFGLWDERAFPSWIAGADRDGERVLLGVAAPGEYVLRGRVDLDSLRSLYVEDRVRLAGPTSTWEAAIRLAHLRLEAGPATRRDGLPDAARWQGPGSLVAWAKLPASLSLSFLGPADGELSAGGLVPAGSVELVWLGEDGSIVRAQAIEAPAGRSTTIRLP